MHGRWQYGMDGRFILGVRAPREALGVWSFLNVKGGLEEWCRASGPGGVSHACGMGYMDVRRVALPCFEVGQLG